MWLNSEMAAAGARKEVWAYANKLFWKIIAASSTERRDWWDWWGTYGSITVVPAQEESLIQFTSTKWTPRRKVLRP